MTATESDHGSNGNGAVTEQVSKCIEAGRQVIEGAARPVREAVGAAKQRVSEGTEAGREAVHSAVDNMRAKVEPIVRDGKARAVAISAETRQAIRQRDIQSLFAVFVHIISSTLQVITAFVNAVSPVFFQITVSGMHVASATFNFFLSCPSFIAQMLYDGFDFVVEVTLSLPDMINKIIDFFWKTINSGYLMFGASFNCIHELCAKMMDITLKRTKDTYKLFVKVVNSIPLMLHNSVLLTIGFGVSVPHLIHESREHVSKAVSSSRHMMNDAVQFSVKTIDSIPPVVREGIQCFVKDMSSAWHEVKEVINHLPNTATTIWNLMNETFNFLVRVVVATPSAIQEIVSLPSKYIATAKSLIKEASAFVTKWKTSATQMTHNFFVNLAKIVSDVVHLAQSIDFIVKILERARKCTPGKKVESIVRNLDLPLALEHIPILGGGLSKIARSFANEVKKNL